jgi:hypothetical protein
MKRLGLVFCIALSAHAQVCSPRITRQGQIDSWDLPTLVHGIYQQARATTPREKAEAIWRFFLTDGRYVKPGFWYHIAGWAYEEPTGEVLDPVKLLNSYGFGLCYHIAPLLAATYDAGGFEDARVWFLTGHTVAEVFYDGAYHYFDSDMMGYNAMGDGDPRKLPVASVHQIEQDGGIILGKLKAPRDVDAKRVDYPWYPADVREAAIDGLAELFTTTQDNRLFPFTRYAPGHGMEFTLRPGERIIRYFHPEEPGLFYLPYKQTEKAWEEFPQEIDQYHIRTVDGPRSQKDGRYWSTGRIEYTPVLSDPLAYYSKAPGEAVFQVRSPYVIIDAKFSLKPDLASEKQTAQVATSTDGGKSWVEAGRVAGPLHGPWRVTPKIEARSAHGSLTAVSGHYGYLVKIAMDEAELKQITLVTRFQMNPRTLPALAAGANELVYHSGPALERYPVPVAPDRIEQFAHDMENVRYVPEQSQGFLAPVNAEPAQITFELSAPGGAPLAGFDAGGRFLDVRDGEAPDKFTAEVRKTAYAAQVPPGDRRASLAFSLNAEGPYTELWHYDPDLKWKDGTRIDRTLRWPEVLRQVRELPENTRRIYVRYRLKGVALDNLRLAAFSPVQSRSPLLEVTHLWHEGSEARSHVERITEPWRERRYSVVTGAAGPITNDALILYCPPSTQR